MSVNFGKNQEEITKAWRKVVDSPQEPNWALFGYEGSTNVIRLMSSGTKGLRELVEEFNCSLIQYAFCRVIDAKIGLNKLILINWQGESAPLSRKGLCASHVGDVANYLKGCTQTITIRNDDEATEEHLMEQVMKTTSRVSIVNAQKSFSDSQRQISGENDHSSVKNSISSVKKAEVTTDIAANRKSFWQRQEEEEKERLAEEKRKAAERQAQFERERKQREEIEARKLAETIEQRDRLIDATRKADKKVQSTSGISQPSSILSSEAGDDDGNDEGRVGRRSELVRLERNQETHQLISKGLIKNKRAIFEQQVQQAKQQQQPNLTRRSSGAMVTQRLNAFKSLDVSKASASNEVNSSPPTCNSVSKLANGFAKKLTVDGDNLSSKKSQEVTTSIEKEVEPVKLVENDYNPANISYSNGVDSDSTHTKANESALKTPEISPQKLARQDIVNNSASMAAGEQESQASQDLNGNSEQSSPTKQEVYKMTPDVLSDELLPEKTNGKLYEAIALYDYEAADNTEISFDPDDKIGFIQKVDPGWWQGKVISGRFKGQIGIINQKGVDTIKCEFKIAK